MHAFEVALDAHAAFEGFDFVLVWFVFDDVDVTTFMLHGDCYEAVFGPKCT